MALWKIVFVLPFICWKRVFVLSFNYWKRVFVLPLIYWKRVFVLPFNYWKRVFVLPFIVLLSHKELPDIKKKYTLLPALDYVNNWCRFIYIDTSITVDLFIPMDFKANYILLVNLYNPVYSDSITFLLVLDSE